MPWPEADTNLLAEDFVEIPIQVNGKLRARVEILAESTEADVEAAAREAVTEHLAGVQVRKVIVIPGRMVNFVVN